MDSFFRLYAGKETTTRFDHTAHEYTNHQSIDTKPGPLDRKDFVSSRLNATVLSETPDDSYPLVVFASCVALPSNR